jgi:hypothetical protein
MQFVKSYKMLCVPKFTKSYTMLQAAIVLPIILTLASPILAANEFGGAPRELGPALTRAAQNGDIDTFLALLSSGTRSAMQGAGAAQSNLMAAQNAYYAAVAERFGSGRLGTGVRFPQDAKAALSRVAEVDVTEVERQSPRRILLRLRTTIKQPDGRTTTQDDSFPAVQESGVWRLDLSELYQSRARRYVQREAAYRRVTQEVLAGAFKDRVSAGVALLRAWRGLPAGNNGR